MIAGVCFLTKPLFYSSNPRKKGRISVSKIVEILTHQYLHTALIISVFNH